MVNTNRHPHAETKGCFCSDGQGGADYDIAIAESTDSAVGVAIDGPTGVEGVSTVVCC